MSNQFYCYLLRLNEYDRKIRLSDSLAVSLNEFQERWNSYAVEFNYPYRLPRYLMFSLKLPKAVYTG